MSYMVIECHSSYAVLLDEEGRFLKAANLQYEVGETVFDPVLMQENKNISGTKRITHWLTGCVAVAAACLLLIFGSGWYQSNIMTYSSICLSINPEVQISLNKQGKVVGLTGTNDDGKILLEGYNGKGKDKVTVAEELIDRAIDMGYLSEGGQVSFSIDTPEEKLLDEYGSQLRSGIKKHLKGRITITIEINSSKTQQTVPKQPKTPPVKKSDSSQQSETPSETSGTDYSDTDYGKENGKENNNAVGDKTPSVQPSAPADANYGPGSGKAAGHGDTDNDSVTDHKQPEQRPEQKPEQKPEPSPPDSGDSDYHENEQKDPGGSDYHDGNHDDNDDDDDEDDEDDDDDDEDDDDEDDEDDEDDDDD